MEVLLESGFTSSIYPEFYSLMKRNSAYVIFYLIATLGLICNGCALDDQANEYIYVGADGINGLAGGMYRCDKFINNCNPIDTRKYLLLERDVFGVSAKHSRQHLFIGAYFRDSFAVDSGSIFRCNTFAENCTEIDLKYLSPKAGDWFGGSMLFYQNSFFFSGIMRNLTGAVFKCNHRGELCQELVFPGLGLQVGDRFGSSMAVYDNKLFVSSVMAVRNGLQSGTLYQCDLETLACQELNIYSKFSGDRFGISLAIFDGILYIGVNGRNNERGLVLSCPLPALVCSEMNFPNIFLREGDAFGHQILRTKEYWYISAVKRNAIRGSVFVCDLSFIRCFEKTRMEFPVPLYFGSALSALSD